MPRAVFTGVEWSRHVHRELFAAYSSWSHEPLEVAATDGSGGGGGGGGGGSTQVFLFFRWRATNTGPLHGRAPTGRESTDFGLLRATVDNKGGKIAEVSLRRSGFAEEREALLVDPGGDDLITPRAAITRQPFWMPSDSLRLRMLTRAHALLEALNARSLDALDAIMAGGAEVVDATRVWDPPLATGLAEAKGWFQSWLGGGGASWGGVTAAATGSAVTPASNKAFLCFRLLLTDADASPSAAAADASSSRRAARGGGRGRSAAEVDGCFLAVFRIDGRLTHLVVWRNASPDEAGKFIGGGGKSSVDASSKSSSSRRKRGGNVAVGRAPAGFRVQTPLR